MAIITLNEYKTHAGITGTADDTRLTNIINAATAKLRRLCDRDMSNGFESATRTEDYESDSADLQLREYPISSITSITPINDDNTLQSAIDSTKYRVEARFGIVTFNSAQNGRVIRDADTDREVLSSWNWEPRWNRVRVVYVSSAPSEDLKYDLCCYVDSLYSSIGRDSSISSTSLGSYSVSYASPEAALKAMIDRLAPYRAGPVL